MTIFNKKITQIMILSYCLKLKHEMFFLLLIIRVVKKKDLPDKLETFKTLQKVILENSSEISRKSEISLFGLKHLKGKHLKGKHVFFLS